MTYLKRITKMTSLTKQLLLDHCKIEVKEVNIEGLGVLHVKPSTELQRSKRIADMFDKNGNLTNESKQRRRVNLIIDHICDKDGKAMFNEGDSKDLLALDGSKLDPFIEAVMLINGELEGNDEAE